MTLALTWPGLLPALCSLGPEKQRGAFQFPTPGIDVLRAT